MAENEQQATGRPGNYKFNRGGNASESGPFIGIVMNNIDPTRQGRLQVAIQEFNQTNKDGTPDLSNNSGWRTVSYCPPFYGITQNQSQSSVTSKDSSVGTFPEKTAMSYGMWFPPPDIGTQVLCFFVAGDATRGYYVACIPQEQSNHMVPAIGAVPAGQYKTQNQSQETYLKNSRLLPVTEINQNNMKIADSTQFYNQPKPVHSYVAAIYFQQGVNNDQVRGPITSSSQRETPSNCYGISTPGRPVYAGSSTDATIIKDTASGTGSQQDINVIARYGGHTFVLDDGGQDGKDNLIRIRTAKGHQITMSDDNNCFYILHANGQTWLEFGEEGTVDIYSTNSVNVRTKGTINLHADKDININAGGILSIKSNKGTTIQSETTLNVVSQGDMTLYSQTKLGLKGDGSLSIQSPTVNMGGGAKVNVVAKKIGLNSGGSATVATPKGLTQYIMPDTEFSSSQGWKVNPKGITSICSRAPTHEPYPYHNKGVNNPTSMEGGQPSSPPGAPNMPGGWSITKN